MSATTLPDNLTAGPGDRLRLAVVADPADDLAREVYADYLRESGEAGLADAIVQQLAEPDQSHTMAVADLAPHFSWLAELAAMAPTCYLTVRRGLLAELECPARWFFTHAKHLGHLFPLERVHLIDRQPQHGGSYDDYYWVCHEYLLPSSRDFPLLLARWLTGSRRLEFPLDRVNIYYPTAAAARSDMSHALVNYARWQANRAFDLALPELPPVPG
jgi:uncharacterized protein (TIGR02996 family)